MARKKTETVVVSEFSEPISFSVRNVGCGGSDSKRWLLYRCKSCFRPKLIEKKRLPFGKRSFRWLRRQDLTVCRALRLAYCRLDDRYPYGRSTRLRLSEAKMHYQCILTAIKHLIQGRSRFGSFSGSSPVLSLVSNRKSTHLTMDAFCLVAEAGLEPTAFGLWARRATNCSTPRCMSYPEGLSFPNWTAKVELIF